MNTLFLTQGKSLALFYDLMRYMKQTTDIDQAGFYVADASFYTSFVQANPDIVSSDDIHIVKEWEILESAAHSVPDIDLLRAYEKEFGDPCLWNALVCDRRIYLGKKATFEQDYPPRFTHAQMLAILQAGLSEMEKLFDAVKPGLVAGFICVTIGDYLGYLLAKKRGIPFINLRPTRIKNYFFGGESIFDPSSRLEKAYDECLKNGTEDTMYSLAVSHLDEIRAKHAMYEGVIPVGKSQKAEMPKTASSTLMDKGSRILKQFFARSTSGDRYDTHHRSVLSLTSFRRVKRPLRMRKMDLMFGKDYVHEAEFSSMSYAFYPLHKEPEVTLLVYSRPYLNQIEVVRNLARSLPVGMKLLVKEHPASIGYRPVSFYQKLLDIPNVVLASPDIESRKIIKHAALVSVICGSVGLEAVMMKKPVIILGRAPFNFLPDTMVKHCTDPELMGYDIAKLLEEHSHDEKAVIAYISAVMAESVPVDFYSRLLGRGEAYREGTGGDGKTEDEIRHDQMQLLSKYMINRCNSPIGSGNDSEGYRV